MFTPAWPLLGRPAERAAIDELLAAARDGLSGSLMLTGEPGIGKTRLLEYAGAAPAAAPGPGPGPRAARPAA
jgi:MoxR-like ATPase